MGRAQGTPSRPAATATADTSMAAFTEQLGTKKPDKNRAWPCPGADERRRPEPSVERVAAGAGPGGVRVVDSEALLLDRVHEVDRGPAQVRRAHPVRDDLDAAELAHHVAVDLALVEVELVAQTGAAARLHGDAQPKVVAALLLQQSAHLDRRGIGEDDALRGGLVLNCHLDLAPASTAVALPARPHLQSQPYPHPRHSGLAACLPEAGQAELREAGHRPGAPQTGNHRPKSGSILRSSPTGPRICSSRALSRRSPDCGANG